MERERGDGEIIELRGQAAVVTLRRLEVAAGPGTTCFFLDPRSFFLLNVG